jgi:hypothetical protein
MAPAVDLTILCYFALSRDIHNARMNASSSTKTSVRGRKAGDFGYAVSDPFVLRHRFGTDAQFRALVAAAHARGLNSGPGPSVESLSGWPSVLQGRGVFGTQVRVPAG